MRSAPAKLWNLRSTQCTTEQLFIQSLCLHVTRDVCVIQSLCLQVTRDISPATEFFPTDIRSWLQALFLLASLMARLHPKRFLQPWTSVTPIVSATRKSSSRLESSVNWRRWETKDCRRSLLISRLASEDISSERTTPNSRIRGENSSILYHVNPGYILDLSYWVESADPLLSLTDQWLLIGWHAQYPSYIICTDFILSTTVNIDSIISCWISSIRQMSRYN